MFTIATASPHWYSSYCHIFTPMVQSALVINWRCQRRKTVPQERLPNLRSLCPAELGPDACLCGEMTETGLTLCGVASYLTVASTGDWICRFLSYQSLGGGGLVTQERNPVEFPFSFLASPGGASTLDPLTLAAAAGCQSSGRDPTCPGYPSCRPT